MAAAAGYGHRVPGQGVTGVMGVVVGVVVVGAVGVEVAVGVGVVIRFEICLLKGTVSHVVLSCVRIL